MNNIDIKFQEILKQRNKNICPKCNKQIDRGDVCWNNGNTECGTGYSVVEIQCQKCDTEILYGQSWYPDINDFEDLVDNVLEEILDK